MVLIIIITQEIIGIKAEVEGSFSHPLLNKKNSNYLITKSKTHTTHSRAICFGYLRSKYAVSDLFRDVAAKVGDRPGGYTRIIKVGNRLGDNADMAMIELVDFNELYNGGKKEVKKAKSRRGGKAKKSDETTEAPAAEGEAEATSEASE